MITLFFVFAELSFLALAHRFGGPPWTVIGAIAIVMQTTGGVRLASLGGMAPSLAWLGLYHATGNRELFFPYSMYLAGYAALPAAGAAGRLGPIGGGLIVAAFLVIRILQQATPRVLAVECAVAIAILALVLAARPRRPTHVSPHAWQAAVAATASGLAYASLAI